MSSEHFSSEKSGWSRVWKECSMIMDGQSTSAEGIDYDVEVGGGRRGHRSWHRSAQ